jgi:hypothetical protein
VVRRGPGWLRGGPLGCLGGGGVGGDGGTRTFVQVAAPALDGCSPITARWCCGMMPRALQVTVTINKKVIGVAFSHLDPDKTYWPAVMIECTDRFVDFVSFSMVRPAPVVPTASPLWTSARVLSGLTTRALATWAAHVREREVGACWASDRAHMRWCV